MTALRWDACWNTRHLGGHRTRSGGMTQLGRVVRSGNLSKLTSVGRDALLAAGFRTVIDLRDARELAMELNPFHPDGVWAGAVHYANVPLLSDASWAAYADPVQAKRGNTLIVELSAANIARAIEAIATADRGGVVGHCHAGKERTGVIAGLLLELAGVPDDEIACDYVASGRASGPVRRVGQSRARSREARTDARGVPERTVTHP